MNPTFIYLEDFDGTFHHHSNCIYEYICKTKKGYYEYVLLIER